MVACRKLVVLAILLSSHGVLGVFEERVEPSPRAEGVDLLQRRMNLVSDKDQTRGRSSIDGVSLLQIQMGGQQANGPFARPVQVLSQQEAAIMGELQQTEQKIQSLQSLLDLQTRQQLPIGADSFAQAPSLLQQQQPWQTQWQQPQSLPTQAQSSLQQRQLAWQPQWQPPQPSDVQEQLKEAEGRLQAEIQEVQRTQQSLEASEQRYAVAQAELQAYRNYVSPMSNNVATQVAASSLEAERKKFDDKDKALRLEQEKLKAEFQKTESTQKDLQQSRGEEKLEAASLVSHVVDDAASKSPEVKQSGIIKDAISKVETIANKLEDHVQNVGHTVADKVETVGQSVGQRVKTLGSMMMPQPQQEATQQQPVSQDFRDLQQRLQKAQLSLQELEKEQADPQLFSAAMKQPAVTGA